jgi:hypothetical protein
MKRACFVCLFLCFTTTFLLSQSNPVSLIHQTAGVASPISASQADPQAQARSLDGYGKLPLSFEANRGQADGRVKFLSRTGGYTLFLTGDEAVLAWSGSAAKKPAPKGASGFEGDTVSLKRYPDTKPELFFSAQGAFSHRQPATLARSLSEGREPTRAASSTICRTTRSTSAAICSRPDAGQSATRAEGRIVLIKVVPPSV